jgi:hypothetical protein
MRDEEQDIHQECQQSYEQCWQKQNKERQQEARRVGGRMEVGRGRQAETNEGQKCGDWVDDEDRGEGFACTGREIEIIAGAINIIAGVSDMNIGAGIAFTISKDTVIDVLEGRQGNSLDNGG